MLFDRDLQDNDIRNVNRYVSKVLSIRDVASHNFFPSPKISTFTVSSSLKRMFLSTHGRILGAGAPPGAAQLGARGHGPSIPSA